MLTTCAQLDLFAETVDSDVSEPTDLWVLADTLLGELCQRFPLGYRPRLEWRGYRTTAGKAHFQERLITLSQHVIQTESQLDSTLKHEYAHLLAFARHGRRGVGHGPAWRKAMADLGQAPKVTHQYDVKRNQARQVVVLRCEKCGETFTRKRALPKRRRYLHIRCGGQVAMVRVERVTANHD